MSEKRHIPAPINAHHGSAVDEGVVLRARSRGVGVPVPVDAPLQGGPPARVTSGPGDFSWVGGQLYITPTLARKNSEFSISVEM
tara:strand:+ start:2857 stop:3108 length:252 start_codon:yes stop_codon:yes gene_type:complete